jgi:tetratricopeptide (TPR) repeat protein
VEGGQAPSREEQFTAWRRFLEAIAERDPAVLVVEDIHWADEAFLAFLEHVADWSHGVPLLVVCTARPELYQAHPTWGSGLGNQTAIRLGPLSDADTSKLVAGLLEQAALPGGTERLLLERAGGNPLYAEEFVRMLRDRELIDERGVLRADADVPVPDSIHALIAARIDSLPPDRKDLLQDASVIGKVFWAGAAESMGSRDGGDVRSALHELARKELVRPSRQSSMEGEAEYTFWHALVRDVVYGQIPRARRAARHLAAADWLENKAGERLEDVADVLAYHTGEALELLESAGDRDQFPDVASRARRFALLAGERAREIDPLRAIEWYDRVLALTPEDDPDRALVLTRWAASVREAGRVGEAEPALSEALVLARDLGEPETLLPVLIARLIQYVDEVNPAQASATDEIIAICEKLPPSALRLETLGEIAIQKMVNGEYATSIRMADEALALAEELDMPLPTRALTARGGSRCSLGDDRGLADSREALEREIAAGAGHRAAIAFNNLAIDTSLFDGIEAALAVLAKGETFASRRGLANALRTIRCGQSCYLGLAGRLGEAIRIADEIIPVATAAGDEWAAHEATIYRAFALSEQGRLEDPEALLTVVRRGNFIVDNLVVGAAAAAAQLVRVGDAARTRAVLDEVLDREDAADSAELALRLPVLVRAAVQSESLDTASALIDRVQPNTPIRQYALASSRAVLAEVRGAHDEAAGLFHEAVQGWRAAGGRLEEAHALLGYGRCLLSLGDSAAVDSLRAARTLFEEMGATPRVVEADSLIERATSPV